MTHEVGHELGAIDGNERAARAFDDEIFVSGNFGKFYFAETDANASALRGKMWRNGRREAIRFGQSAVAREAREAEDGGAIGAVARAGLNGLPVKRVERRAEQGGDGGFAHGGVCASDEETARHARRLQLA